MNEKLANVLVVDDDDIAVFLATAVLERFDPEIAVKTAPNGEQALQLLESGQAGPVDLILLDVNMPLMDGYAFLDWYHESYPGDESGFKPCVAMYSTATWDEEVERTLEFPHVVDYIEKPLDFEKIEGLTRKLPPAAVH
ncbi:MAG: response regulator [Pseudomonadota bacterium]